MKTDTLTVNNLATLFGVTAMTVYNWRHGRTSKAKLPKLLTPAAVKEWAVRYEVPMKCTPRSLLGNGAAKPGPKPRAVPAKKKKAA